MAGQIVALPDGRLAVADAGDQRTTLLDREDGHRFAAIPAWPPSPTQPGLQLYAANQPAGLAVAPDGSLYVTDQTNGRLLRFVPN